MKMPSQLKDVSQSFGVIRMHVGEEDRGKLVA
jgi:hypothetical protein